MGSNDGSCQPRILRKNGASFCEKPAPCFLTFRMNLTRTHEPEVFRIMWGELFMYIYICMYIFSVTGNIYIIKCHKIYMTQIREVVFSVTHRHLQGSKHHRWLFKEQRCLSSSFLQDTKRVRRCENIWICWIFLMTCHVVRNGLKLSMVSGNSHVHHFRTSRCCTLLWRASTMRLRRRSFRMVIWSQKHPRTVGDS